MLTMFAGGLALSAFVFVMLVVFFYEIDVQEEVVRQKLVPAACRK